MLLYQYLPQYPFFSSSPFRYFRHSEGHQRQAKEILDLKDFLEILSVNLLPEDPILSIPIEVDFQIH